MLPLSSDSYRSSHESCDLVQYLALFGLDLGAIQPEQVAMFIAARGAASYVEDLQIPIAARSEPDDVLSLRQLETDEAASLTGDSNELVGGRLPSDEMEVATIRSTEQLARIFPAQWLLEEVCPDVFYAKVAQRALLMPDWREPTGEPRDSDSDSPDHELVEERAQADRPRQHAYLLLDTSGTMNDHDRRGTVARGLALAFLLKGRQQRSQLNFRPFTSQVDALSSGSTKEEFHAIVRRVIEVANSGQTRIQTALERAVRDIRKEGPCLRADVMLITDGISRLTENPFGEENLHTFLIGDLLAEDKSMEIVRLLRAWSRNFRCVWLSRYKDLLRPALGDIQAADRQLRALAERASRATEEEAARLHRMLENIQFLIAQWKQAAGRKAPVPAALRAIEEGLAATAGRLPPAPASPGASGVEGAGGGRPAMLSAPASGQEACAAGGCSVLWPMIRRLLAALRRVLRRAPAPPSDR
ncbi:MAG: VWA domain-containing protein [Pirellulales bacterium]|nr:VWA domain-containing protein [Pirellulales bacterium]